MNTVKIENKETFVVYFGFSDCPWCRSVVEELIHVAKDLNVEKLYYAEVVGTPEKHKVLKGYLEKNKEDSLVKIYTNKKSNAAEITTEYSCVKTSGNTSLLSVKIKDGKTHQIRAHLAYIGHPIIGDGKYGDNRINKQFGRKYQQLFSYKLVFEEAFGILEYLKGKNIKI
jgi:23S rRNA pseudouridine955/2504/2580 synthase